MAVQKSTHKMTRIQVETGDIPKKPLQRQAMEQEDFSLLWGPGCSARHQAFERLCK